MARQGRALTEEQKKKMQEGRKKRKETSEVDVDRKTPNGRMKDGVWVPYKRYSIKITGQEETGFDFFKALRIVLRPATAFMLCHKIEREIIDPAWWKNIPQIHTVLKKYVDLEIVEPTEPKKPKKEKKVRAPLSEERKAKLTEQLRKAREAKKGA